MIAGKGWVGVGVGSICSIIGLQSPIKYSAAVSFSKFPTPQVPIQLPFGEFMSVKGWAAETAQQKGQEAANDQSCEESFLELRCAHWVICANSMNRTKVTLS
jgi:hypothetical protein